MKYKEMINRNNNVETEEVVEKETLDITIKVGNKVLKFVCKTVAFVGGCLIVTVKTLSKCIINLLKFGGKNLKIYFSKPEMTFSNKVVHGLLILSLAFNIHLGLKGNNSELLEQNSTEVASETASKRSINTRIMQEEEEYLIGTISVKYELEGGGKVTASPSRIATLEDGSTEYGIGQFNTSPNKGEISSKRPIEYFLKYLRDNNSNFYELFKNESPGEDGFNKAWNMASDLDADGFKKIQMECIYELYVKNFIKDIKDATKVDFEKKDSLKELAYSVLSQYGHTGGLVIINKSEINKKMNEEEIIQAIQDEKLNSIGVYTYVDTNSDAPEYGDAFRAGVKARIPNETKDLLGLVENK